MINLLPPKEKKEILEEERFKSFLIIGILCMIFLTSLSLVLLSIRIYISGNTPIAGESRLSQPDVEKEVQTINKNLLKLSSFYKEQSDFTALIERISQTLPKGSYITNLSIIAPSVSLRGYSPTRENLLELKKKLEAEPGFKNVNFPPSNWANPRDIEFNANFQFEP